MEDEPGRSATHLVAQRGGGPLRGVPDAGQHDPEDNQDLADENLGRGYAEIPPLLVPARCLPARVGRISYVIPSGQSPFTEDGHRSSNQFMLWRGTANAGAFSAPTVYFDKRRGGLRGTGPASGWRDESMSAPSPQRPGWPPRVDGVVSSSSGTLE